MRKKLSDLIREYHLTYYLIFAIILCVIRKIILFHQSQDPFSPPGSLTYTICNLFITIAMLLLFTFVSYASVISKLYNKQTGRSYWKDSRKYMRGYRDLVTYFRDADPGKLDPETLPEMSWQESSGLVFGKSGSRLISYEP